MDLSSYGLNICVSVQSMPPSSLLLWQPGKQLTQGSEAPAVVRHDAQSLGFAGSGTRQTAAHPAELATQLISQVTQS